MRDKRNLAVMLMLVASLVWGVVAWRVLDADAPLLVLQRTASLLLFVALSGFLVFALKFEDRLPDHLREQIGTVYYGVDGLEFMPTVRSRGSQAELCVFYQNRYENTVEAIVHLRPPEDSFIIRPGVRDVHFAFRAGGGDFGAIHLPIAVPQHLQGEVIDIQLAAASHWPRSHGACLRRHGGMPCGTLRVDWGGAAFRSGVHEVSGEIELVHPTSLHLCMPTNVNAFVTGEETWRQERLEAGVEA